MISKTRSVVIVAVLIIIAGCSAPATPTTTTQSDTDATTPTNTAGQPTTNDPTRDGYPPGTNESGIVDRAAIFSAHSAAIANQSYALQATQRIDDGSREQVVTIQSNPDQMRTYANATGTDQLGGTELYITESAVYVKQGSGDRVQYAVQEPEVNFSQQHKRQVGVGYIIAVVNAGEFGLTGQRTEGGTAIYTYDMESYTGNDLLPENATETSGTVEIGSDGIVRLATVQVTLPESQGNATLEIEYRVTGIGDVTVSEPAWIEAAKQQGNTTA